MANTLGSNNPFPSVLFAEHVDPANPSAGTQRLFVDTDHLLKLRDSSGTVVTYPTSAGGTGTLATVREVDGSPTDSAVTELVFPNGTLGIVSHVATYTPASSGGVSSGTSFPGSPATNDLYFRTDRGLLYYYDGTRWLTIHLFSTQLLKDFSSGTLWTTASATRLALAPVWSNDYDVWLVDFRWTSFVSVTNNGGQFWTMQLSKVDGTSTTSVVAPTTAADSASTYVTHKTTIGALLGTATDLLALDVSSSGSPGGCFVTTMVTYRLVG